MSRFKFRVWDGVNMFLSPDSIEHLGSWFDTHAPGGLYQGGVEFMQWTGLQDKNGKDIYEGDIVKMTMNCFDADKPEGEEEYKKEFVSSIVWRGHGFWVADEDFGWEGENLWDWNLIEVIGNIYENPELLNT